MALITSSEVISELGLDRDHREDVERFIGSAMSEFLDFIDQKGHPRSQFSDDFVNQNIILPSVDRLYTQVFNTDDGVGPDFIVPSLLKASGSIEKIYQEIADKSLVPTRIGALGGRAELTLSPQLLSVPVNSRTDLETEILPSTINPPLSSYFYMEMYGLSSIGGGSEANFYETITVEALSKTDGIYIYEYFQSVQFKIKSDGSLVMAVEDGTSSRIITIESVRGIK